MKLILVLTIAITVCTGCGSLSIEKSSLEDQVPAVTSIVPTSLLIADEIEIEFSVALDADSLTAQDIMLVAAADFDSLQNDDWSELQDDLEDYSIPLLMELTDDNRTLLIRPAASLEPGSEYRLIVFPSLRGASQINFNQSLIGDVSYYSTLLTAAGDPVVVAESDESIPVPGSVTESDETTSAETESAEETIESTLVFDTNRIFISEVVTDPQLDHDDSSGGDGVAFNDFPGDGTVSSTDEFVEISNGTNESVDVSLWSLKMLDGTDVTGVVGDGFTTHFGNGGSIGNLGSGESLVLGNPSGMINNSVTLELYDETQSLVDSVVIDDANATGESDEAWTLDTVTGEWSANLATPGWIE